jgi:hypothetical protein
LSTAGGGVDLCGDEPGRHKPADAENGCREVEDDDARDSSDEEQDVEVILVGSKATEHSKNVKAYYSHHTVSDIDSEHNSQERYSPSSQNAPLTIS